MNSSCIKNLCTNDIVEYVIEDHKHILIFDHYLQSVNTMRIYGNKKSNKRLKTFCYIEEIVRIIKARQ